MRNRKGFTLVEMLVVISIIAILAGMLTGVILYARNLAIRAECQQNLNHIGQTVSLLVFSNNGLYPQLTDADPTQQASDAYYQALNSGFPWNNSGFPWWARVFEQWKDLGLLYAKKPAPDGTYLTYTPVPNTLDAALNPDGHVLIPNFQVPKTMSGLHCRMAGALDGSTAANLFSSISYGINFDVKDATGLPYCASSNSSPYSVDFPNNLSANDKQPDQYRSTEILNPSQFILISEANTQGPEWNGRWCGVWSTVATYNVGDIVADRGGSYYCLASNKGSEPPNASWKSAEPNWTGGRISPWSNYGCNPSRWRGPWSSATAYNVGDIVSDSQAVAYYCVVKNTNFKPPCSYWQTLEGIVGRHSGYANVLFADYHVEAIQITSVPGQVPSPSLNINYDYSKWTLPGK